MSRLQETIARIRKPDQGAMDRAAARQARLTKPTGSLGRLEETAIRLAGMQGRERPCVKEKAVIVMAGDHGVIEEGIVDWPQEVTAQMVLNFLNGGAGINVISRSVGARVIIVDVGVASDLENRPGLLSRRVAEGTRNIAKGPAMTREQAMAALEVGMEVLRTEEEKGLDIVATGEMGICNTTPSAAICSVMTGKPAREVTGRGTGLDDDRLEHKIRVVEEALSVNRPDPGDALDVLAKVGGYEIGGLAGVMLEAASRGVPVVLDGFISGAAALIAAAAAPGVTDYMIAGHRSTEPGHRAVLDALGLKALLDLDMRLGEGTGAALSLPIIEAAAAVLSDMATFEEAGVAQKEA